MAPLFNWSRCGLAASAASIMAMTRSISAASNIARRIEKPSSSRVAPSTSMVVMRCPRLVGCPSPVDGRRRPLERRHVAPEPLELVVVALLFEEHVDHEVAVVHEDPTLGVEALDAQRTVPARGRDLLLDLFDDGLDLAGVGPAGDHEPARDGQDLGH